MSCYSLFGWIYDLFCLGRVGEKDVECLNYEKELMEISSEIGLRSSLGQLESLSKDKTHERVYHILKTLVKERHYQIAQLETLCIGLNIWLYSVPVPPGHVSINPDTHFQCRRVLRVFLGTSNDWNNIFKKSASSDVSFNLNDTAFQEEE